MRKGSSEKSNIINVETLGLNNFNSMLNMFTINDQEEEKEDYMITNFNCNEKKNIIDNLRK